MPNIWKITLTNQHNATYTCALMDIPHASALKRLEIKWEPNEAFVATVEPKPEGVYIKEVALQGEHLGFPKATGMLLPADPKPGDTWQVSAEKKKRRLALAKTLFKTEKGKRRLPLAGILFKMDVTVVESEPQRLVLSVNIEVNGRAPVKKLNRTVTVEAVVSINPHADFQIERVQFPNGDTYEKRA